MSEARSTTRLFGNHPLFIQYVMCTTQVMFPPRSMEELFELDAMMHRIAFPYQVCAAARGDPLE